MANNPIELLMGEHQIISAAREVIAKMDDFWLRDAVAYEEILNELLSFFQKYSDGFHHQKEERVLFPALTNNPEFSPQALLEELEEHHQTFRENVEQMRRALAEKKYDAAQDRLERYFEALLDHIAVENDELFVMTEALFSDAELEKMYFRFRDVDSELGPALKKELETVLPRLRARL